MRPPSTKTDTNDAQWLRQLLECGLLRASFVPPKPIRELHDLTRNRETQIEGRPREIQRLEKPLQDAGIKLSSVASRVLGVSGWLMLDALLQGTHDPDVLAALAKSALRRKLPALREALEGRFTQNHALSVSQILARVDFFDEANRTISDRVDELIVPSIIALSKHEPVTPIEGTVFVSRTRWLDAQEVNCTPRSEWITSPSRRSRRWAACRAR